MATFRTLFSGGELFGIGACQAGYTHVDGYEIDPKIAAIARMNGFDVRTADVCDINYECLVPIDHLHVSPSCKHASQANVNAGETDEDIAAADAVCRAIRAHQGATFSLENVWAYRNFESFARILHTLHAYGYVVDFRHINAADYGVPQTRKRLILRAVRGRDRVLPLHPTHRKGGDMFHPAWIGWYQTIADLIPSLPETEPAPWQLQRLPAELRETLLIGPGGFDGTVVAVRQSEPSFTVPAALNHAQWRAFLLGDQSAGHGEGVQITDACAPAFTVRSSDHNSFPRAYLCGGGNTQLAQVDSHARAADEPAFTLRDGRNGSPERALLLSGENAGQEWSAGYREHDDPAFSLSGSSKGATRAYIGRWVRLTVQALGRFQTVPDSYIGLTPQINGNGVPCLLAQRIMESFR